MPLGPKPPRRLQRGQEQHHPHRTQERDRPENRPGRIPPGFAEHRRLGLRPQREQKVELAI